MGRINRKNWARDTAVAVHDKNADFFNQQYNELQDRRDSAFLYGRQQIDLYFRNEIEKLPENSKILDVGCGTGEQVKELLKSGFEAVGLEPSSNMRKYAHSHLPAGAVMDGSILNIPFSDNYFDCVYAIEVLRYLHHDDNITSLKEIYRVLKPGGLFFGTFVNRYAADGFIIITKIRRMLSLVNDKAQRCHVEFETPKKLSTTLHSIGFSDVEIHGAMIPILRFIYKIDNKLGKQCAKMLEPYDKPVSDHAWLRPFSGHLIGIARKNRDIAIRER